MLLLLFFQRLHQVQFIDIQNYYEYINSVGQSGFVNTKGVMLSLKSCVLLHPCVHEKLLLVVIIPFCLKRVCISLRHLILCLGDKKVNERCFVMGTAPPTLNLACFMLNLKIINIFLKKKM